MQLVGSPMAVAGFAGGTVIQGQADRNLDSICISVRTHVAEVRSAKE